MKATTWGQAVVGDGMAASDVCVTEGDLCRVKTVFMRCGAEEPPVQESEHS